MKTENRQVAKHVSEQLRRLTRFVIWLLLLTAFSITSIAAGRRIKTQALDSQQILEAEQLLSTLGYWTGPVDGVFDPGSRHALVAFQKVEGRKRTGKLTNEELEALRVAGNPVPKYTGYRHVEIDLERQVLFHVDEYDVVTHVLPVCTGNEKLYVDQGEVHRAHTPTGNFKVLRKISGVRISTLGFLYYPNYIYGGIAIHGSWTVAAYPASHGCIRIPMFAAKEFSRLTPVGTEVVVF